MGTPPSADEPPDGQARIYGVPARATRKSGIAWSSGSKATQIRAGVPPTLTIASSTNMRGTSLGSVPRDPRTEPGLCAHLHIGAWLSLMGLRDLAARLREWLEK